MIKSLRKREMERRDIEERPVEADEDRLKNRTKRSERLYTSKV